MEEKQILTEDSLPPKITKQNIDPLQGSKKGVVLGWLKAVLFTVLSALLIAVAAYSLIAPNEFTIGGASGIAILLNKAFHIPQSVMVFGINLPLIVCSFFFVKKRFAILTSLNIVLQSLFLLLLEEFLPNFIIDFTEIDVGAKIFAALAAGLCIGTAVALAFKVGGSTGGADILAVMIQKKFKATSIAWMIFIINFIIIACSIFVYYDPDSLALTLLPIMMSAFESYIESKTNESMTDGFQSAIEFRIITDKPEEMATAVMRELSRGVTAMPATGMYTKENKTMLLCVISRRQVATLRKIMREVDPDSFAVMAKVSQVLGLGFYSAET